VRLELSTVGAAGLAARADRAHPVVMPRAQSLDRERLAVSIATQHDGVASRFVLHEVGIDRHAIRAEVRAGRWLLLGANTVRILSVPPGPRLDLWRAIWEAGRGALLDGAAGLVAQGMTGFELRSIDLSLPRNARRRAIPGVTAHLRRTLPPSVGAGLPRVRPALATIHAAQWAVSDRQAALLLCLPLQQRLVRPREVLDAWRSTKRSPRRTFLDTAVLDVCDGAQALGELDFAWWCRRYRIPEPERQHVVTLNSGRVYLDARWRGLVVEVDGGHHFTGLNPVDDALRANEVVIEGDRVLRLPVLGLRLAPREFMSQIARAVDIYVPRNAA
jgi:hypothetical protein